MNTIFDRLADISLRRIYKFILKKLIGEYLGEELVIEQFVVESRVGLISINDLSLNVVRINEELTRNNGGVPPAFAVKSVVLSSLQAKIQYSTILTEGINLHADGISIDIVPSSSINQSSDGGINKDSAGDGPIGEASAESASPTGVSMPAATSIDAGSISDTDLSFIAEWVDIILGRLVVTVGDVRITVFGEDLGRSPAVGRPRGSASDEYSISDKYSRGAGLRGRGRGSAAPAAGVALQLVVSGLTFHYTHPSDMTSYTVAGGAPSVNRSVTFQLPGGTNASQSNYKSGYDRARKGERRLLQLQGLNVRLLQLGPGEPFSVRVETQLVREVDMTVQLQQRLVVPSSGTGGSSARRAGGLSGQFSVAHMSMSAAAGVGAGREATIVNDIEVSVGDMLAVALPLSELAMLLRLVKAYGPARAAGGEGGGCEAVGVSYAVAPTVSTVGWLETLCAQSRYPAPLGEGGVEEAAGAGGGGLDEGRLDALLRQYQLARLELLREQALAPGAEDEGLTEEASCVDQSMVFHSVCPMAGISTSSAAGLGSGALAQSTVVESDDDDDFVLSEENSRASVCGSPASVGAGGVSLSGSGTVGSGGGEADSMGMSMFQSAYAGLCDSLADASVYSSEAPAETTAAAGKAASAVAARAASGGRLDAAAQVSPGAGVAAGGAVLQPSDSSLKLRVHFRCISIALSASDSTDQVGRAEKKSGQDQLLVVAEHVLLTAAVQTHVDASGAVSGATKLEVALRELGLFDRHADSAAGALVQPLITFEGDVSSGRGTIISAPSVRVSVVSSTAGMLSRAEVKVEVLPIVASATVDRIDFWTHAFSPKQDCAAPIKETGVAGNEPNAAARSSSVPAPAPTDQATEMVVEFRSIRFILVADAAAYSSLMDHALGERGNYLKLLGTAVSGSAVSPPYQWRSVGTLVWSSGGGGAGSTGLRSSMYDLLRQTMAVHGGGDADPTPVRLAHVMPHCGLLVRAVDVCIRINPPTPPTDSGAGSSPGDAPGTVVEMEELGVHLLVNASDARLVLSAEAAGAGAVPAAGADRVTDKLLSYGIFSATSRPSGEAAAGESARVTIDLANSSNVPNTAFSITPDDDEAPSSAAATGAGGGHGKMTMVHISAYRVAMVSQKYQYDLMLLLSGAISPVAPAAETADGAKRPVPPPKSNKFGIWFSATVAVIQLSQDEASVAPTKLAERVASPVPGAAPAAVAAPIEYTVAIREPMIQVLVVDTSTKVCINASDISIYERPVDLPELSRAAQEACAGNVGPRWGEQRYNIPLIHRTKLHCPWDHAGDGSLPQALPHVFEFEMVLDESVQGAACHKRMGVRLALQDVTLRYDLASVWLLNIVDILTPAIDERVQEDESEGQAADCADASGNMDLSTMLQSDVFHDPLSDAAAVEAVARRRLERSEQLAREGATPATYRMTTISILVSRFMVDYCCPVTPSRVLFSVGLMSLDSNMNSISAQVKLKFKVHDVALHLSNQLNDRQRGYLEQAPLVGRSGEYEYPGGSETRGGTVVRRRHTAHPDQVTDMETFLDTHMFVQLCTLDSIDLIVTINDDFSGAALCIGSTVGVCCMYACLDSLNILVKTLTNWWDQFKPDEEEAAEAEAAEAAAAAAAYGSGRLTGEQSAFRGKHAVGGPVEGPLVMPLYPASDGARAAATAATVAAGTPAPSATPSWMRSVDENAFAPRSKPPRANLSAATQEHFLPLSQPFEPYLGGNGEVASGRGADGQWGTSSTMLNMRSVLDGDAAGLAEAGSGFMFSKMSRSGIATGGGLAGAMIDDFFPMPEKLRDSIYPGSVPAAVEPGSMSQSVDMNSSSFQQARWFPVYDSDEEGDASAGGAAGADADDGFQVYYEDEEEESVEAGSGDDDEEREEVVAPRMGKLAAERAASGMSRSTPALSRHGTSAARSSPSLAQSQSQRLMIASIPNIITLQQPLENYMGGGTGGSIASMPEDVAADSTGPAAPSSAASPVERPRNRLTPKFAASPRSLTPMSPGGAGESALASAVDVDTDEEQDSHHRRERAKSDEIDTEQNLIVLDDFCNSSTSYSNSSMFYSAQLPVHSAGGALAASISKAATQSQRGMGLSASKLMSQSTRHWVKDTAAIQEEGEGSDGNGDVDGDAAAASFDDAGRLRDCTSVVSSDGGFEERIPQHKFGFQGSAASTSNVYMSVLGSWMGGAPKPAPEPEAMEMSSFGRPTRQQKLDHMRDSRLVGPIATAISGTTGITATYCDTDSEDGNGEVATPDVSSDVELEPGEEIATERPPFADGTDMSRSFLGPVPGILRRADEATPGDKDYQQAWRDQGGAPLSQSWQQLEGTGPEQQARWFDQADQVKIISHHVPLVTAQQNSSLEFEVLEMIHADHARGQGSAAQSREADLVPTCIVNLQLSIRLRLFAGCDWENSRVRATPAPSSEPVHPRSSSADVGGVAGRQGKGDRMRAQVDAFLGETADNTTRNAGGTNMSSSGRLFREGRAVKPLARDKETDRKEAARAQARAHAKAHMTREMQDMLEVSVKDAQVYIRLYPRTAPAAIPSAAGGGQIQSPTPCERIMCNAQDVLVSYAKVGLPNTKILGCYKSASHPRQCNVPFVSLGLVGYLCGSERDSAAADDAETPGQVAVEHRLHASIIPVRVFLDENVINFVKGTLELSQQLVVSGVALDPDQLAARRPTPADASMFFQLVQVRPIDIKIDYNPSPVDFTALQQGDYLQILNLCPIDGLAITLGAVLLTGISNANNELVDKVLQIWTDHIVKHQLHRIVTGATPFGRGISNITAGIQNLLMIPLREFSSRNRATAPNRANPVVHGGDAGPGHGGDTEGNSGGTNSLMVRQMTRGTASLLSTVTREALHYSHKLTMMVAHGITDLVAENSDNVPRAQRISSHIQQRARTRQPQNLTEGLSMGFDSVAREVHTAMDTVVVLPIKQYQRTGNSKELVKEVVTALPIAILRPIGGAAEAVSYTLLGLRNRLDPNARVEEEDLYQVDHARPTVTGRGITSTAAGSGDRSIADSAADTPSITSPFTASTTR